MVNLEFRIEEEEFRSSLASEPDVQRLGILVETYFDSPVRFSLNGVELLESPHSDAGMWYNQPLLNVALTWPRRIGQAQVTGAVRYSMPGSGESLWFECSDSNLTVRSGVNGRSATIGVVEVLDALRCFEDRVRGVLVERYPPMTEHRELGRWLSAGEPIAKMEHW